MRERERERVRERERKKTCLPQPCSTLDNSCSLPLIHMSCPRQCQSRSTRILSLSCCLRVDSSCLDLLQSLTLSTFLAHSSDDTRWWCVSALCTRKQSRLTALAIIMTSTVFHFGSLRSLSFSWSAMASHAVLINLVVVLMITAHASGVESHFQQKTSISSYKPCETNPVNLTGYAEHESK